VKPNFLSGFFSSEIFDRKIKIRKKIKKLKLKLIYRYSIYLIKNQEKLSRCLDILIFSLKQYPLQKEKINIIFTFIKLIAKKI
jgi:hypothetical protein